MIPIAELALVVSLALAEQRAPAPKVLLIGIDGFRPSILDVAKTPNLDSLIERGCHTFEALTDEHTISGAGWSNLLTGTWANQHGVVDNEFTAPRYDLHPHVFGRLASTHPEIRCGHFCDWVPIDEKILGDAKIAARFHCDYQDDGDARVVAAATAALASSDLDFTFVYFADLDETGHTHGFHPAVPPYREMIERIDAQIGQLLAAIASRPSAATEDWLVIVSSDHGGTLDKTHGRNIPEHRAIPFIASGRAAKRGRLAEVVNQVDVVPTALAHLGIEAPAAWRLDGHAVGLRDAGPRLDANLVVNGGADANGGLDSTEIDCSLTAFADTGSWTSIRYGAPGGYPGVETPGPKDRGPNFFCGGNATTATIEQRIDVSKLADAIDAGAIAFSLAGWLGGFADQRDLAWVDAEFLDSNRDVVRSVRIGPVTLEDRVAAFGPPAPAVKAIYAKEPQSGEDAASDAKPQEPDPTIYGHLTGLLERKAGGTLPPRTRIVRIRLGCEAGSGSCDGYVDSLSFVLMRQAARGDAAEVEGVLRRILAADNAGDLDAIVACYTDDVVLMPPGASPLEGADLVRERYRAILAASTLALRAEVDEIRVDGDSASIRGITIGESTPKDGSGTRTVRDNFLMLMRRDRGEWRISRLMWHARP